MMAAMRTAPVQAVHDALCEAHCWLAALTVRSPRLDGGSVVWPDIVRTVSEAYGYSILPLSWPTPTAAQITEMDRRLAWIALIPPEKYVLRRVVSLRSIVHYWTGRNLFSGRRIAHVLGCDERTVRTWHQTGLEIIVSKIPLDKQPRKHKVPELPSGEVRA